MKILLTGATGYIGKRLLPVLIEQEHEIYACTRDKDRDHKKKRLLLYAEMILPCYAWLEFKVVKENGKDVLK